MVSVNTNYGALVALQNLNATQSDLQTTQNRITTTSCSDTCHICTILFVTRVMSTILRT